MRASGRGPAWPNTAHLWPEGEDALHELEGIDCACGPVVERVGLRKPLVRHRALSEARPRRWRAGFSSWGRPADYSFVAYCHACGWSGECVYVVRGQALPRSAIPTEPGRCPICGEEECRPNLA